MKREGVLFGILFLILIGMFFVSAELTPEEKIEKVDLAYTCLNEQIDTLGCSRITFEDKVFVLLANGKCSDDFLDSAGEPKECWPEGNCDLVTTSQVILGLEKIGKNVTLAKDWLLSHTKVPEELNWYLEIDGLEEMTCTVSDGTSTSEFFIGEDKKLQGTARGCFTKSYGDYWLKIDSACYGKEFVTSCDNKFITTLLFQEKDSETINILDYINEAGTDGETIEKINSICFEKNGVCDYEGSLWTTSILDYLGESISGIYPYLIAGIEDNSRFIPESFLYHLTNSIEYKTSLMEKQISEEYWQESGDKFYDTALALLPFQYDTLTEKTNSENWLLGVQGEEGCWDNEDIINTAFILYSIWPDSSHWINGEDPDTNSSNVTDFSNYTDDSEDCVDFGYYCMSRSNCEEGNILAEFDCLLGMNVCCNTPLEETSCYEEGGQICSYNEDCSGNILSTDDLSYGEVCCTNGICEEKDDWDSDDEYGDGDCESLGEGVCEIGSCEDGYTSTYLYQCSDSMDTCCIKEKKSGGGIWIWILFALIILVVLGILFRDKLSLLFLKFKSKFGKSSSQRMPPRRPGFPPEYSRSPRMSPPMQRRIIPRENPLPARNTPPMAPSRPRPRAPKELDDVLKKLKDMSK